MVWLRAQEVRPSDGLDDQDQLTCDDCPAGALCVGLKPRVRRAEPGDQ